MNELETNILLEKLNKQNSKLSKLNMKLSKENEELRKELEQLNKTDYLVRNHKLETENRTLRSQIITSNQKVEDAKKLEQQAITLIKENEEIKKIYQLKINQKAKQIAKKEVQDRMFRLEFHEKQRQKSFKKTSLILAILSVFAVTLLVFNGYLYHNRPKPTVITKIKYKQAKQKTATQSKTKQANTQSNSKPNTNTPKTQSTATKTAQEIQTEISDMLNGPGPYANSTLSDAEKASLQAGFTRQHYNEIVQEIKALEQTDPVKAAELKLHLSTLDQMIKNYGK